MPGQEDGRRRRIKNRKTASMIAIRHPQSITAFVSVLPCIEALTNAFSCVDPFAESLATCRCQRQRRWPPNAVCMNGAHLSPLPLSCPLLTPSTSSPAFVTISPSHSWCMCKACTDLLSFHASSLVIPATGAVGESRVRGVIVAARDAGVTAETHARHKHACHSRSSCAMLSHRDHQQRMPLANTAPFIDYGQCTGHRLQL